jgi:hypothetical protein
MNYKIKRFERKWIFNSGNYLALINAIIRSDLFFRYQYPKRNVNSIYFDTKNYLSIKQNFDGISEKKKVRIRWYGDSNIIFNPLVEIKSKKGFETKKETILIDEIDGFKFSDYNKLELISEKLNLILNSKKTIYPILTTNYIREYFISLNGKIRATIDYNLKSNFLNNLSQIDIVKNFKNICILELKYPVSFDRYVRQNIQNISLRLTKNSKFINSAIEKPKFVN